MSLLKNAIYLGASALFTASCAIYVLYQRVNMLEEILDDNSKELQRLEYYLLRTMSSDDKQRFLNGSYDLTEQSNHTYMYAEGCDEVQCLRCGEHSD